MKKYRKYGWKLKLKISRQFYTRVINVFIYYYYYYFIVGLNKRIDVAYDTRRMDHPSPPCGRCESIVLSMRETSPLFTIFFLTDEAFLLLFIKKNMGVHAGFSFSFRFILRKFIDKQLEIIASLSER